MLVASYLVCRTAPVPTVYNAKSRLLDSKSGVAIGAESSVDPRVMHLQKLVDLAASYVLTTRGLGLTFHRGPKDANPRVMLDSRSASDASWSMYKN